MVGTGIGRRVATSAGRLAQARRGRQRWAGLVVAAVGALGMATAVFPVAGSAQAAPSPGVVTYPVSFRVVNSDQVAIAKAVPGAAGDGRTYTVQGHITAPAAALDLPNRSAALYVSGHGYGEWFWHLTSVPADDYATVQAEHGLTSVTIDKLGYGTSPHPDGLAVGYGTEATVDHQILDELRSGNYQMNGGRGVTFSRLALVGSSQAAFSVEAENATFHDEQGIVLAGFADEGFSLGLIANYSGNVLTCQLGPPAGGAIPAPAQGSYPANYAFRETSVATFNSDDLGGSLTSPQVTAAADSMHTKDPCGYPTYSVGETLIRNNLFGFTISVPVLSVMGDSDSEFFPAIATAYQKDLEFALNKDATVDLLANTPQALTLGKSAPLFQSTMAQWLCARSFGALSGRCAASPQAVSGPGGGRILAASVSTGDSPASGAGTRGSLAFTGTGSTLGVLAAATLILLGATLVGLAPALGLARRRRSG